MSVEVKLDLVAVVVGIVPIINGWIGATKHENKVWNKIIFTSEPTGVEVVV